MFHNTRLLDFQKFPNCLCGISTQQLKILLWKGRPNSPTHLQDCTIFCIQLTNAYNELKLGAAILC